MAFPTHESVTRGTVTSGGDHAVVMPATVNAGDLLLVAVVYDGAPTIDTDALVADGFALVDTVSNGSAVTLRIWHKVAEGDEDGVTYTQVLAAASRSVYHVRRISNWYGSTAGISYSGGATGTGTSPDPPDNAPSWGSADNLWITLECHDDQADTTAYPTNYSTNGVADKIAAANGVGMGSSYRTNAAASENPGSFTINSSQEWIAYTIAVRPAAETNLGTPAEVKLATVSVGTPALTQDHALTPTGVAMATVSVGTPELTSGHDLGTPTAIAAAPSVGTPALTQDHALQPSAIASEPSVGNPALTQDHGLTPTGIAAATVTVGTPELTQDHALSAGEVALATVSVDTPALSQAHTLAAGEISLQPSVGVWAGFDEDVPENLLQQTQQKLVHGDLVELLILDLNPIGVAEVHYLSPHTYPDGTPLVYNGNSYTYAAVAVTGVDWSANGDPPNPKVSFPNAKKFISSMVLQYQDLVGASVRRIRTYVHFLDGEPLADPDAVFSDDTFRIEQKLAMNPIIAEFALRPVRNIDGRQLPNMVCLKSVCVARYRRWDADLEEFVPDTSSLACPYDGVSMFTIHGAETTDPTKDACSHDMPGCILRFGDAPLPGTFKPGMLRVRL